MLASGSTSRASQILCGVMGSSCCKETGAILRRATNNLNGVNCPETLLRLYCDAWGNSRKVPHGPVIVMLHESEQLVSVSVSGPPNSLWPRSSSAKLPPEEM